MAQFQYRSFTLRRFLWQQGETLPLRHFNHVDSSKSRPAGALWWNGDIRCDNIVRSWQCVKSLTEATGHKNIGVMKSWDVCMSAMICVIATSGFLTTMTSAGLTWKRFCGGRVFPLSCIQMMYLHESSVGVSCQLYFHCHHVGVQHSLFEFVFIIKFINFNNTENEEQIVKSLFTGLYSCSGLSHKMWFWSDTKSYQARITDIVFIYLFIFTVESS